MIIGLTGRIAAGKGVVANYLKGKGFNYLSLSQAVRDEATKRGIEHTRKNLQDLGNELRIKQGNSVWAQKIIKLIVDGHHVIDGIRNHKEILELKKLKDFILVSVDAPQEIRFKRVILRGKISDPKIWEDFLILDKRDFGEENDSGQQVSKCMELADIKIINNYQNIKAKIKEIEKIFKEILKECC